jgi:hypothetical protein
MISKHMQIKNVAIGIGIIIMTLFVVIYGINTFYHPVDYDDFCDEARTVQVIESATECENVGGKWIIYDTEIEIPKTEGWCDRDYFCRQAYEDARETKAMCTFIIAVPIGILIIALGMFLFSLEAVGAGLMGGGVATLIYGTGSYWEYGADWMRFTVSIIGLVALIFLAYWFNSRDKKKKGFVKRVFG